MHCLPSIKYVKAKFPQHSIEIMLGSGQIAELLKAAAPFLDKVWHISHKGIFNKAFAPVQNQDEQDLLDSLSDSQVDYFIFLHSSFLKAYYLNFRFFKAKFMNIYKRNDSLSAVENFAEVCNVHDFKKLDSKTLDIRTHKEDYIAVVPGVGHLRPHRAIPLESWKKLIEKTNLPVKILGGPDEKELSKEIDALYLPERVENLIGKTSLLELAKILKSAKHLYSCDTGILHIAAALNVPSTSYFSITSEKRFGPFNPNAEVLRGENCKCQASLTNVPKHCLYAESAYAPCMQAIDIASSLRSE